MEASRFKRRATQKNTRQNQTKTPLGNTVPVQEAGFVRPRTHMQQMDEAQLARIKRARAKAAMLREMAYMSIRSAYEADAAKQAAPAPVQAKEAPAQRRSLLDMSLPGAESQVKTANLKVGLRKLRKLAFRGMAVSLVLTITFGGLFLSQGYFKFNKVFKGGAGTAVALKSNVDPNMLKGEGDGRVNILVMGRGGGKHIAPDLTDTMMIMSVDPVNKSATLLSIPRDLWVQVPGGGPMKINAAWKTGEFNYSRKLTTGNTDPKAIEAGFKTVDSVLENALGINIHYNMLVNFEAFKQAVDTVGGVVVNAPTDLVDPTMAWENANNPVLAKAGPNKFNGDQALMYSRSRMTSNDFARAERQRALFLALKDKVQQLGTLSNPVKVSGLLTAFGNNVATDLSFSNANRLYKIMKSIDSQNITSSSLADDKNTYIKPSTYKGQYILTPTEGNFKFTAIHSFVRTQLKDPYIQKENAKVLILNGTPTPGIAGKMADLLKAYGYNVVPTSNTPSTDWNKTVLIDVTHKNKYTKNYLENRLGMTASDKLSDTSIPTNGADFVIIMGSDEVITAQTESN